MQLDKMKKADLVKLARELRQELKLTKKKSGEKAVEELPLYALSQVTHNGVDKIIILKYDLDTGKGQVVDEIEEINKDLANYLFDKKVLEYLDNQVLED